MREMETETHREAMRGYIDKTQLLYHQEIRAVAKATHTECLWAQGMGSAQGMRVPGRLPEDESGGPRGRAPGIKKGMCTGVQDSQSSALVRSQVLGNGRARGARRRSSQDQVTKASEV